MTEIASAAADSMEEHVVWNLPFLVHLDPNPRLLRIALEQSKLNYVLGSEANLHNATTKSDKSKNDEKRQ